MTEEWRDVPGWEGYYQVSDQGRVKSVARIINRSDGTVWPIKERVLRSTTKTGYHTVQLSRNGKPVRFYVHRLVLLAFIGDAGPGFEVCHNDGQKDNNILSNLRWDTHSANGGDTVTHGQHPQARKTHCKRGHEFTPENTKRVPGRRICRKCDQMHQANYAARRAGAAA